jgi:hypothetical protein
VKPGDGQCCMTMLFWTLCDLARCGTVPRLLRFTGTCVLEDNVPFVLADVRPLCNGRGSGLNQPDKRISNWNGAKN